MVRLWIDPRAQPEDLSCINTSPWGEALHYIGLSAGGVIRYDNRQHKVLEIFITEHGRFPHGLYGAAEAAVHLSDLSPGLSLLVIQTLQIQPLQLVFRPFEIYGIELTAGGEQNAEN